MSSSDRQPRFSIRRADWNRDHEALRAIRTSVFVEEQSVPVALEWDGEDEHATHLLAEDTQAQPIGTARLLPSGQIGRMAVVAEWRGRGVGRALLQELLAIAAREGGTAPFLNAQSAAVPFYSRFGLRAVGEGFMEAGIPHRRMILQDDPEPLATDLSDRILGETSGSVELRTRDAIRAAGVLMTTQTHRELRLLSHDLDPDLYDNRGFLQGVRRIALQGRGTPVRILLFHAEPAIRKGHRLIEAARHLSSKIQIRRVPVDFQRHNEAYLLADDRGYVLRRLAAAYEATADFNNPKAVRRLGEKFDQIWNLGDIHQELRRLYF
jgi:predicted GNAT family N-acyltransferase